MNVFVNMYNRSSVPVLVAGLLRVLESTLIFSRFSRPGKSWKTDNQTWSLKVPESVSEAP